MTDEKPIRYPGKGERVKRMAAEFLAPTVALDYYLRGIGAKPDRWHWADRLMLRLGYYLDFECELRKLGTK